jgi:hypothetical protein
MDATDLLLLGSCLLAVVATGFAVRTLRTTRQTKQQPGSQTFRLKRKPDALKDG